MIMRKIKRQLNNGLCFKLTIIENCLARIIKHGSPLDGRTEDTEDAEGLFFCLESNFNLVLA